MIKMVHVERHHRGLPDIACPKIFCDYCERPIDDAGGGLYMWEPGSIGGAFFQGEPAEVFTVHKGACDRGLCQRQGWERHDPMTMEISCLLVYLGANMGIVSQQDWRRARDLAEFGGAA